MLTSIEAELKQVVDLVGTAKGTSAEHRAMLAYHMGWEGPGAGPDAMGKRLRPLLVLLACSAAGGDWQQALPAAAAVELVHNFSLVHDDVQDNSALRRGRPTLWKQWGTALAINAGDALFALANTAVHRLTARGVSDSNTLAVQETLNRTCLQLTNGQHLDLAFEARLDVSLEDYWRMIEGKTAALFAAGTQIGATLANASRQTIDAFRWYGRALGLAFQVQDDWLGVWGSPETTGKSNSSDLLARKKSLPILAGIARSEEFRRLFAAPTSDATDVERMIKLLEACGAREYTEDRAAFWSDAAMKNLQAAAPTGPAAETLRELTQQLLERRN